MRLVDVTLRDGGHQLNFDWPEQVAVELINSLAAKQTVEFIELGYWRQTGKFSGSFYNFDRKLLGRILEQTSDAAVKYAMMVDFHYCSKVLTQYPSVADGISLFRITARKEHIGEAIEFAQAMRAELGTAVSLNIFNVTNYVDGELRMALEGIPDNSLDFVYFADTHGALHLESEIERFTSYAQTILSKGAVPGFHLHNHSGRALQNFDLLSIAGYQIADASVNGLGKGLGNLKLEEVVNLERSLAFLDVWRNFPELFSMPQNPFGIVGARHSVTDHYAMEALARSNSIFDFERIVSSLDGEDKDNYSSGTFDQFG